ncbi:MAG: hypothetical protein ACUVWV_06290 [Thermodesulfobacteriota bacterium]
MKILGTYIFLVSPLGMGRAIKSLNQIIAVLNTLTIWEAIVLGKN